MALARNIIPYIRVDAHTYFIASTRTIIVVKVLVVAAEGNPTVARTILLVHIWDILGT